MSKAPSISVFFPAYNDAGTIASLVVLADRSLRKLTDDYEIMVVNDGSADDTALVRWEPECLDAEWCTTRRIGHTEARCARDSRARPKTLSSTRTAMRSTM